ncbi:MAG: helix-turn-helix transcriptional regulator [Actinomycetaceae bacterium]|nr:helix-turn-helix transcriptional regulator [Actinomycetaceae bacterium]
MQTVTLPALTMREHIGEVLRRIRQNQGRTLREVSAGAQVSLGYLSEIERGQKEASSELLEAICSALEVPLSQVLHEVADRLELIEAMMIPDAVPEGLLAAQLGENMTLQS